jgi:hypothetical protein
MRLVTGRVLTGPAGTATEVVFRGQLRRPDWQATLGVWFLHCPGQSPAWSHFGLSLIHLRPIEGVPDAVIRLPHATHEVILAAYDPAANPMATDLRTWRRLFPINLMEQIQMPSDESARYLLDGCALEVVKGNLWAEAPLSGQVEPWRTVLIKSSAHARGEVHAS